MHRRGLARRQQLNFGIDFESGTRIAVSLDKATDDSCVTPSKRAGIGDAEVQQVTESTFGSNTFQIETRTLQQPGRVDVAIRLDTSSGIVPEQLRQNQRRPDLREPVANSAAKALIFSSW